MVAEWKIKELQFLKSLISKYKTVGVVDFYKLPASNLREIREKLRGKVLIRMSKKKLILRALTESGIKIEESDLGLMPALIFSDLDPISLYKLIRRTISKRFLDAGEAAPVDIEIPAGPTNLLPMAMAMLRPLGLKVAVDKGKIKILQSKVICKAGEKINPNVSSLLRKLGLKYGISMLKVLFLTDKKIIYREDALKLIEMDYTPFLAEAVDRSIKLAYGLELPTNVTIRYMIERAARETLALLREIPLPTEISIKESLKKALNIARLLNERIGGGK